MAAIVACPLGSDPWPGVAMMGMTSADRCTGLYSAMLFFNIISTCVAQAQATRISSSVWAAGTRSSPVRL